MVLMTRMRKALRMMASSLQVLDWGVAHDPAHFYANATHAALRHSFTVRVKWVLGAHIVNRKVEQIRQGKNGKPHAIWPNRSPA
jgi:hypothetical protein